MTSTNAIETFEHAGRIVDIYPDYDAMSPDEWDSAGTAVLVMDRNTGFGDEQRDPIGNYRPGWDVEARYRSLCEGAVVLPLHFADYGSSGSRISVETSFDSNYVNGIIYTTADEVDKEWSGDRGAAEKYLRLRVAEWSQFLEGDVYGFTVSDHDGNVVDSCWSFYGFEYAKEAAREAAEDNPAPNSEQMAHILLGMEVTR